MGPRILDIRVRPARVAILISKQATSDDLLLAFEFCSRIWGGRFAQILPVELGSCDPLTEYRLAQFRPDYVYGIGLDDELWAKAVVVACQPRGFGRLSPEFVRGLHEPHAEEYILVGHALADLLQKRDPRLYRRRRLTIVTAEGSPWAAHAAALFGLHYKQLKPNEHFDESHSLTVDSPRHGFLELARLFANHDLLSWLDVAAYKLNLGITWGEQMAARIVLVDSAIEDLSLFWNLRTATDGARPAPIIPLPLEDAGDEKVLSFLSDWVLSLAQYGVRSNYCLVTSQTVGQHDCCKFAAQLQGLLAATPTPYVDYEPPKTRLPVVIPYESTAIWPALLNGRKLSFLPPTPKAFDNLGSSRTWFVDLIKDTQTGRAIKELELPSAQAVAEVLNGPCPPTVSMSRLPTVAYGVDSINISCSSRKDVVKVYLPTPKEILTELLRDKGVEPVRDEKRSAYLPVIKRFGGVHLAARAFSSVSRKILTALYEKTKTLPQIKGECHLGDGTLPDDGYLKRLMSFLDRVPERTQRIAAARFARYTRGKRPDSLKLIDLLEMWANRSIVLREWKVGPCAYCAQTYFEAQLTTRRRVVCPGCGNRIALASRVDIGYSLHRAVRTAIAEGMIPVVPHGPVP